MEDQAFYSLKNSLMRLKKERDEITSDLLKDKQNMIQVESSMRKLKTELDFRVNELKEKENNLNDYDKVIKESENTLQRVRFYLNHEIKSFLISWLKLPINWQTELILKEKVNEEGDLIAPETLQNLKNNKFALKGK